MTAAVAGDMRASDSPVALVTGGAGTLGSALTRALSRRGYRVVVQYHSSETRAKQLLTELPNEGIALQADVTNWDDVRTLVDTANEQLGPIAVVFNNAAVRHDGLLASQSVSEWRRAIDVNLIGTFHVTRAVVPAMLRVRYGRIVNVISPSALVANAGQTAYCASKAGVVGLTRTLAVECGRRGVTVNALSPGLMQSALTDDVPDEMKDALLARATIKRLVTPEEVTEAGCFILDSPSMTGQIVSIDGGLSL